MIIAKWRILRIQKFKNGLDDLDTYQRRTGSCCVISAKDLVAAKDIRITAYCYSQRLFLFLFSTHICHEASASPAPVLPLGVSVA